MTQGQNRTEASSPALEPVPAVDPASPADEPPPEESRERRLRPKSTRIWLYDVDAEIAAKLCK